MAMTRRRPYGSRKEIKYYEGQWGDLSIPTLGFYATNINAVTQGTAENQRIGRKFTVRSISVRGEIKLVNTANQAVTGLTLPQWDIVRVLVVLDKQPNGTTASMNEICSIGAASSGSGSGQSDFRAFRNMDNISRFDILMEKFVTVKQTNFPNGGGSAATGVTFYNMYKRCNIPVEMKDVTGSVANITTNNISVYMISSTGYALGNFVWRTRFTDE